MQEIADEDKDHGLSLDELLKARETISKEGAAGSWLGSWLPHVVFGPVMVLGLKKTITPEPWGKWIQFDELIFFQMGW